MIFPDSRGGGVLEGYTLAPQNMVLIKFSKSYIHIYSALKVDLY
jgi:hypothetical protein